jgi:hypothetical protein
MEITEQPPINQLALELGDIIKIFSPTNEQLHEKIFLIDYLDQNKIKIINDIDYNIITLNIKDGQLTEKTIDAIHILVKQPEKGYSRQNGLITGKWVEVHIAGDVPTILTGLITDLEEDMIEIELYPNKDVIYIDFAYKGIPEDIPIELIKIRDKPIELIKSSKKQPIEQELTTSLISPKDDITEEDFTIPSLEIKGAIKDIIAEGDELIFGDELDAIVQEVQVPEKERRYDIDAQTDDLLNDLLSSIPNQNRTNNVLKNIKTTINRFIQLREIFSTKDDNDLITGMKKKGANYKPLVEKLYNLNTKLYWLLPVVKTLKLFDSSTNVDLDDDVDDVVITKDISKLLEESLDKYHNNEIPVGVNPYDFLLNSIHNAYKMYDTPIVSTTFDKNRVNTNIEVLIDNYVDNMNDFYSTVYSNNTLKSQKFVISKFNLGINKLKMDIVRNKIMDVSITKATNNDNISIKSFVTLPEPYIRFSHISLPSTNIYNKTNLNHIPFGYWNLLKKNLSITNEVIDNIDKPYQHTDFLSTIKNYVLDKNIEDDDKYRKFIETIIPKTKVLFDIISKYITYNTSFNDIIKYLEPFMIYNDDITFSTYKNIIDYIQVNIIKLNKKLADGSINVNRLKMLKNNVGFSSKLLLNILDIYSSEVSNIYKIYNTNITSSELINQLMEKDYGKYFFSIISNMNIRLYSDINPEELIENVLQDKDAQNRLSNKQMKKCKDLLLVKSYSDYQLLVDDNSKSIGYSSKYDNTNYDILDMYQTQRSTMDPEEFKQFLTDILQNNSGLTGQLLEDELEALLLGYKPVKENNYAILIEDYDLNEFRLFKRENNSWLYDNLLTEELKNIPIDELHNYFCTNLQGENTENTENIINRDLSKDKNAVIKNEMDRIMNIFDDLSIASSSKMKQNIDNQIQLHKEQLTQIMDLKYKQQIANNNKAFNIGVNYINSIKEVVVLSPYLSIRDRIMGLQDINMKYNYLIKFIDNYTRTPIDDEEQNWFYCIDTSTKLLPAFYEKLALAYLYTDNYLDVLDEICKSQGKISDDGDKWVDKYSGYVIRYIEFVDEDTYDEKGFKTLNYDTLQEETITIDNSKEYDELALSPDGKLVSLIINALITGFGVRPNNINEFIIDNVLNYKKHIIMDETKYNLSIEKLTKLGKKVDTYINYKNYRIILFTTLYFLIAIQTHIPILKITKPMAGHISSISGFPVENSDDFSALSYVIHVLKKISNDNQPWITIKKKRTEKMKDEIINMYNKLVSKTKEVENRIQSKLQYLKNITNNDYHINEKYSKWDSFLPPLKTIKSKTVNNITSTFKDDLQNNIRIGSKKQIQQMLLIKSKIMYFSLEIQKNIEQIISKEELLLTSKSGIPFIENFCCNIQQNNISLDYFNNKDKNISIYNDIVTNLSKLKKTIDDYSKAPILFSENDTKLKYPSINKNFDETTIYQAFIEFCKFNKNIPINDNLLHLCTDNTSAFEYTDTIEEKINIMKSEGKVYNSESMLQLLDIVNRENIVHISLNTIVSSTNKKFTDIINYLTEKPDIDNPISIKLTEILSGLLDTFDLMKETQAEEIFELEKYLNNNISKMRSQTKTFIKQHIKLPKNKLNKINEFIDNFDNFNMINSSSLLTNKEETVLYTINYIQNCINDMIDVIPYMIFNQVYKNNDVKPPLHWDLSIKHQNDFTNIFVKYFNYFKYMREFSQDSFSIIRSQLLDIKRLVNNTPFINNYFDEGIIKESVFNASIVNDIYVFYFLKVIEKYISITNTISDDIEYKGTSSFNYNNNQIISSLLLGYFNIFIEYKDKINYNREQILEQILKTKEYEKDTKTNRLKDLTEEQRNVDGEFRKAGLGVWNIGLQKGLTQYVKSTYDDETTQLKPFELDRSDPNFMSYDEYEAYNMENIPEDGEIDEGYNYPYQENY